MVGWHLCVIALLLPVAAGAQSFLKPGGSSPRPAPAAEDVLLARDGSAHQGSLHSCTTQTCLFDRKPWPRTAISAIGFGVAATERPRPSDRSDDEVQLRNGASVKAKIGRINPSTVSSQKGAYPRGDVLWVLFAPPSRDREEKTSRHAGTPTDVPGAPGLPELPKTPPTPPLKPLEIHDPGLEFPRVETGNLRPGARWSGWLRATRRTRQVTIELRATVRLQEMHEQVPGPQRVPKGYLKPGIYDWFELHDRGTTVAFDNKSEMKGCRVISGASGVANLDTPIVAHVSRVITSVSPKGEPTFSPWEYVLGIRPKAWMVREQCEGSGGRTQEFQRPAVAAPLAGGKAGMDPHRPRLLEGGRMIGRYENQGWKVSWAICREGENCPSPDRVGGEVAPDNKDDCGDLARERSLVDVIWEQRKADAAALEIEWNRLQEAHREMKDNIEAYRSAIGICAIQDVIGEVLGTFVPDGVPQIEFVNFVTSVLGGDIGWSLAPEPWGTLAQRLSAAYPSKGGYAAFMRGRLDECSSLLVNAKHKAAAYRFVDQWERVRQLMPAVQEKINRVRTRDQDYWDRWNKYHKICVAYAQCKKIPPQDCPEPPAEPRGPMP